MQADTAMESFSYKNQRILEEMNAFGGYSKSKNDSNNSPPKFLLELVLHNLVIIVVVDKTESMN